MSELIRQIVERTYRSRIGLPSEWSPEQQRLFLDREAARPPAAPRWRRTRRTRGGDDDRRMGQAPGSPRTGPAQQRRGAGTRQVLTEELYALVPQDPDDEPEEQSPQPPGQGVDWGNPDRWRTPRRSEPTEAIQTLVAPLWPPNGSDWFAIKAEYLLQTRSEDGHELPNSPHSPLARELASLVETDLADDGLSTG